MTPHFLRENWNGFKTIVLFQLFIKSESSDGAKTFLESQSFSLFLVKFKKLGFTTTLKLHGLRNPN